MISAKKSDKGVDLLASLSHCYDASEVELKTMMETVNGLIVNVLKKKPCHASECKTESLYDINTGLQVALIVFGYYIATQSIPSFLFSYIFILPQ